MFVFGTKIFASFQQRRAEHFSLTYLQSMIKAAMAAAAEGTQEEEEDLMMVGEVGRLPFDSSCAF